MPAAEARIPTIRADRYLTQLCEHTSRLASTTGHRPRRHTAHSGPDSPPKPRSVEHSGSEGTIDFGWARCTLTATDSVLILHGEADEPGRLEDLQQRLTQTLERIGRRDGLAVTWTPADDAPAPQEAPDRLPDAAAILNALMTPEGRADPYPLYAAAHRLGPYCTPAEGIVLVTGYTAVNDLLRNPAFGPPEPATPPPGDRDDGVSDALRSISTSILRANPPDHPRMRSLISRSSHPAASPRCDRPSKTPWTVCSTGWHTQPPTAGRWTSWKPSRSNSRSR